jgi:hypothetical protein
VKKAGLMVRSQSLSLFLIVTHLHERKILALRAKEGVLNPVQEFKLLAQSHAGSSFETILYQLDLEFPI